MIKNLKQNKTAALFTFMVTAILLYDLPFDIALFIPEQCHNIVCCDNSPALRCCNNYYLSSLSKIFKAAL